LKVIDFLFLNVKIFVEAHHSTSKHQYTDVDYNEAIWFSIKTAKQTRTL